MAKSNSVNSNSWKQDNGTYRYFTLGWSIIDTDYDTRQYKVGAYIDLAGNNYQYVYNACKLYLYSNNSWVNVKSATRIATYNSRRCYYEFWLSANDDGVAECSLKMEGSIFSSAWNYNASLPAQSVSGYLSKVTSAPSLSSISISSDFRSISASCSITSNGKNGSSDASISEFKAYLYENDNKSIATATANAISDETITWTSLGWETLYGVTFLVKNDAGKEYSEHTTIRTKPFIPPSGPENVKITYTPSNEEPTIVSSYNLSWNEPNWGSVPDGCFRYFRMRIVVVNKNGVTQYIGYKYGNTNTPLLREWSDIADIWYDFDYLRTGITICKDTYSGELAKLEVGDTISICVHSINYFDGKNFVSDSTWSNTIGPIQDDQAKVKLLDHDSKPVTGKVWVKDKTGTWRKAKKIYVDTGTTSKNWEKSTNPTS